MPTPLYLEVFINNQPTRLIAAFEQHSAGRIGIKAGELKELGLKPPSPAGPDDTVFLNDISALLFDYNAQKQTINIDTSDELRLTKHYDAKDDVTEYRADMSASGAVLNYSLFA
ncbi:MAG: hypothetical protein OER56_02495, partial [Hyphomicrobiales bacterium]|nr:hypothetical protein [Hyphomicrobiales bacterium]